MTEKVHVSIIYQKEESKHHELTFYGVLCKILVDQGNKNNTPLHCSFLAYKIFHVYKS